jgi:hypothetical protein
MAAEFDPYAPPAEDGPRRDDPAPRGVGAGSN